MSAIAHVVSWTATLVRIPLAFTTARSVVDVAGLLCAGAICAWLLTRAPRLGTVRTVGLMLLVLAFFGPILWAWYLTWGVVVLSAVATGRLRKALVAIAVLWTVIGVSGVDRIARSVWEVGFAADALLLAGLIGLALMPLGLSRHRRGHRSDGSPAETTSGGSTGSHSGGHLTGRRTVTELA
jgi:alpha-1,6-mannosyltransferase